MTLTNARKAELRWEAIDAAFTHWESLTESETLTPEESLYLKQVVSRAAKALNVDNHMFIHS